MGKDKVLTVSIFKQLHLAEQPIHAIGSFQSLKGKGWLNHLFGLCIGIPIVQNRHKIEFDIFKKGVYKIWRRNFESKSFSTQTTLEGLIFKEKSGVLEFEFFLNQSHNTLIYEFRKLRILNLPIPKIIAIKPTATCVEVSLNKWTFNVVIKSPFGTTILNYWGEAEIYSTQMKT